MCTRAALLIAVLLGVGAGCSSGGTSTVTAGADPSAAVISETTTSTSTTSTTSTTQAVEAGEGVPCEASMLLEAARAADAIDPSADVAIDEHRCVETYAYGHLTMANNGGDSADAYFRYALPGMGWRLIDLGSDVDTADLGIPDDVLAELVPGR